MVKRRTRWFILLSLFISFLGALYFFYIPDLPKLKKERLRKTSFMEYRIQESKKRGKPFRIYQIWVPLSKISPFLVKAVLIAEDDKFWSHEGFDYEAIQKALERDMKARKLKFGGSTISQQLARNLYLSPEKSLVRKMKEAAITWRMEKILSKRRILELYLNLVEWGDGIFGVEAASRHYYGKPSSELTPQEAAQLAAVLPNPRRYNPIGNQRYVVNRSNAIYTMMIQRGIIAPEYEEVTTQSVEGENTTSAGPIERPNL
jgi:monofunctional biosynthetic peptidoglycan transglycosylase